MSALLSCIGCGVALDAELLWVLICYLGGELLRVHWLHWVLSCIG